MAQKIVLTPEECRLPTSELAQKYGISRTSAWRAAKRGWLWQAFHEKTIQQDPAWAEAHAQEILRDARRGAWTVLRRWADNEGCGIGEMLAPFEFEDVVGRAVVRILELAGYPDRDVAGWRIKVAQHAARDFMDWLKHRRKSQVQLDPDDGEDSGRPDRIFARVQPQNSLVGDEMEAARARLVDLVPDEILDIAVRVADGEKISRTETAKLASFREKWSWLVA